MVQESGEILNLKLGGTVDIAECALPSHSARSQYRRCGVAVGRNER